MRHMTCSDLLCVCLMQSEETSCVSCHGFSQTPANYQRNLSNTSYVSCTLSIGTDPQRFGRLPPDTTNVSSYFKLIHVKRQHVPPTLWEKMSDADFRCGLIKKSPTDQHPLIQRKGCTRVNVSYQLPLCQIFCFGVRIISLICCQAVERLSLSCLDPSG